MGAQLLIALVVLLLSACGKEQDATAHGSLACASCHSGALPAKGVAAVPDASCTSSGCHADHGPSRVDLGTVRFKHRDHGRSDGDAPHSCAGCHSHQTDSTLLSATLDACILCHRQDVLNPESRDCAICHGEVGHVAQSEQGVDIPHAWLRADPRTCLRCHYDVGETKSELSSQRCLECHDSAEVQLEHGAGTDLHPIHTGFSCLRCHGPTEHRIRALSSAVQLNCAECHSGEHPEDVGVEAGFDECMDCHEGQHSEQQRLMLGLVEGEGAARPATMFMAGLNCSSCHVERDARPEAATCTACHEAPYTKILGWWRDGAEERVLRVRTALDRARAELPAGDPALATAEYRLEIVAQGGGHHNIQLSDRLLREALEQISAAYESAGKQPPALPDLGPLPRRGFCSSCHYSWDPDAEFKAPPTEEHRRFLRGAVDH